MMAIFRGESSYVSSNWYPTKKAHHRHVPTWNYEFFVSMAGSAFNMTAGQNAPSSSA